MAFCTVGQPLFRFTSKLLTQSDRVDSTLRPLGHKYSPDFPLGFHIRIIRQPGILGRIFGNVDDGRV